MVDSVRGPHPVWSRMCAQLEAHSGIRESSAITTAARVEIIIAKIFIVILDFSWLKWDMVLNDQVGA